MRALAALGLLLLLAACALPAAEATSSYPGWRFRPPQTPDAGTVPADLPGTPPTSPTPDQAAADQEEKEAKFLAAGDHALTFFLILMLGMLGWMHLVCVCGD